VQVLASARARRVGGFHGVAWMLPGGVVRVRPRCSTDRLRLACVDVAGGAMIDGTAVQLYDCNGTTAQRWTLGTDGTVTALGKCLDVAGGSTANGAKVQLYE